MHMLSKCPSLFRLAMQLFLLLLIQLKLMEFGSISSAICF